MYLELHNPAHVAYTLLHWVITQPWFCVLVRDGKREQRERRRRKRRKRRKEEEERGGEGGGEERETVSTKSKK